MRRLLVEAALIALLAGTAALLAQALASPARRVELRPRAPQKAPEALHFEAPRLPPEAPKAPPLPAPARKEARRPEPPPAAEASPAAEMKARYPRLQEAPQADITGAEAAWLHARGAVFVDARRSAQFFQGHIPRAKNLPAWEEGLADKAEGLALGADLDLPLVVYCTGGDCQDSHLVAQKLWLAGFRNLRIYADGFPDWEKRGLPVAKGEAR